MILRKIEKTPAESIGTIHLLSKVLLTQCCIPTENGDYFANAEAQVKFKRVVNVIFLLSAHTLRPLNEESNITKSSLSNQPIQVCLTNVQNSPDIKLHYAFNSGTVLMLIYAFTF